jgi:hypothetical protein
MWQGARVGREVLEAEDGKEMGELKVKSADRIAEGEAERVQLKPKEGGREGNHPS